MGASSATSSVVRIAAPRVQRSTVTRVPVAGPACGARSDPAAGSDSGGATAYRPTRCRRARLTRASRHFGRMPVSLAAPPLLGGALLPRIPLLHAHDLDRRDLVLRTVRRPVRVLGRHDVRGRLREVEGRVDDTRLDPVRHPRSQYGIAGAAHDAHPIAVTDAPLVGIVRMDLE